VIPAELPALAPAQLEALVDALVVDLRAPVEFAQDHWPGARNVPLFDDAQRALVGTLYRQASPDAAFDVARDTVRARVRPFVAALAACGGRSTPQLELESLVDEFTAPGLDALSEALVTTPAAARDGMLVLYCQRGGMRSRSTAALLGRLGWERVAIVEGGYKAWRLGLVERLAAWRAPRTFVLRGLTGVGKTLVLRELERLAPGSTLDLEDLAQHRSSVLGMVGRTPRTQKQFETQLALRLPHLRADLLFIEGESRKVGSVIVPPSVWSAMTSGDNLELAAPLERRVDVLLEDYLADPNHRTQLEPQLAFLDERLRGRGFAPSLVELLHQGRERELVTRLLEHYYDPLYRHSEQGRALKLRVDASDPRAAAERLLDFARASSAAAAPYAGRTP
jgi:tRNA 2-selenouridine synthase